MESEKLEVEERLHSAIGYITPKDKLASRETEIFAARDRKLEEARARRAAARAQQRTKLGQRPNGENGDNNSLNEEKTATAPAQEAARGVAVSGLPQVAYAGGALSVSV